MKSEFFIAECASASTPAYGQFSISTIGCHDLFVLCVRGDLDLMTGDQLSKTIEQVVASGAKSLVIDLTLTDFLGAAGLTALDYGRRRTETAGGRFAVVAPGRATARPITALGLDKTLNTHRSVNAAMTACGRGGPASRRLVSDAIGAQALTRPA